MSMLSRSTSNDVMNALPPFTRKDVIDLTGLTGGQVDNLCKLEIVVPIKIGGTIRPTVLYTWHQLLDLKIISKLRVRRVPVKTIYGLVNYVKEHNYNFDICSKYVLVQPLDSSNIITKNKKYLDPAKYSTERVESSKDNRVEFTLLTREDLIEWENEMFNKLGYIDSAKIAPIGDVVLELRESAKSYNLKDKIELAMAS